MTNRFENLYQKITQTNTIGLAAFVAIIALFTPMADAAVVQRGTSARPTTSTRVNVTGRMPTMTAPSTTQTSTTETTEPDSEPDEEIIIENKSSQFDEYLADVNTENSTADTSARALADAIAAQRAALDADDAVSTATTSVASGQNACDIGLRQCMTERCGNNFYDCRGDTDTIWGNKMDACRNDIDAQCTGEEYRLFAAEIKADRDMNARLASYNAVIDCGNQYNDCIITECGTTFSKCLGKSAGDAAIAKCKTIADNCVQQDSGLASRTMSVFGALRQDAEVLVQRDEQRLYDLRDQMREQCRMLGATLDDRSLDCVFTVEFYAGDDSTLFASKKAYAGGVFDCTPDWFGIDVTTFMENAYRLTRSQTSATASLMGSGVGIAAGAIASGAINRAIDRQKAENALKEAQAEHDEKFGDQSESKDENSAEEKTDENAETEQSGRPSEEARKAECENKGGVWENNICKSPDCGEGQIWDDFYGRCTEQDPKKTPKTISDQKAACTALGNIWSESGGTCLCKNNGQWDSVTATCGAAPTLNLDNTTATSSGFSGSGLGNILNSGSSSGNSNISLLGNTTNANTSLINRVVTPTRGVASR